MKRYLPLFLLVLFYYCTNQNAQEISFTIISGTIHHSKTDIHPVGLVTSAIRNGIEIPDYLTELDTNGHYSFKIPLEEPTEMRLQYGSYFKILYVHPSQNLVFNKTVSFDVHPNQSASEKLNWKIDTIIGSTAALSQKMNKYDQLFRDSFQIELYATLPYFIPNEFKTQRSKITNRIERFTKEYIAKNTKDDEALTSWIINHTKYRLGMDYLRYAFKRRNYRQLSPDLKEGFPEAYFDFWETYPIENPAALNSLNYQNYLQLYQKYLFAKLRFTTPYQDCKKFPNCNAFELEINQITKNLSGETKDIVLAQQADYHLIRNDQGFLENGLPLFLKEITDSLKMESVLTRKTFLYEDRPFEFPANASLIQSDATGKEILMRIAEQNADRKTILYFWNTQRPVVKDYPRIPLERSMEKLDSMNYNLVMLAHHSSVNIWKEKIVEKGLTGEQWHLNDEQFEFFYHYFQVNRKPHANYDRILDRENFLLLINGKRNLSTLDNISFREHSFSYLGGLYARLGWYERDMNNNRIVTTE